MKHILIIICTAYGITTSGCKTIARIGYGAHKTGNIENKTTILTWLNQKAQINTESVYTVAPDQFYYAATRYDAGPFIFGPDGKYLAVGRLSGAFCRLNLRQCGKTQFVKSSIIQ